MLGEVSVYHPRNLELSPFWKLLSDHYHSFEQHYEEKFEKHYGFFRPVISEVIRGFLKCGDLKEGFARVRCPDCGQGHNDKKSKRMTTNLFRKENSDESN